MKLNIFSKVLPIVAKHSPEILLGLGLASVVGASAGFVVSTIKAKDAVYKVKEEKKEPLTKKDIVKTSAKYYIIPTITLVGGIAMVVGSNRVLSKRNATLAALYSISEASLQTWQNKVEELTTPKAADKIKSEVAKEQFNAQPQQKADSTIIVGGGDVLFLEPITGRYFKSSWPKIEKAAISVTAEAQSGAGGISAITLNQWFDAIGLARIEYGDYIGWDLTANPSNTLSDNVRFTVVPGPDNVPCGSIDYRVRPTEL